MFEARQESMRQDRRDIMPSSGKGIPDWKTRLPFSDHLSLEMKRQARIDAGTPDSDTSPREGKSETAGVGDAVDMKLAFKKHSKNGRTYRGDYVCHPSPLINMRAKILMEAEKKVAQQKQAKDEAIKAEKKRREQARIARNNTQRSETVIETITAPPSPIGIVEGDQMGEATRPNAPSGGVDSPGSPQSQQASGSPQKVMDLQPPLSKRSNQTVQLDVMPAASSTPSRPNSTPGVLLRSSSTVTSASLTRAQRAAKRKLEWIDAQKIGVIQHHKYPMEGLPPAPVETHGLGGVNMMSKWSLAATHHDAQAGPKERELELRTCGSFFDWNPPRWQKSGFEETWKQLDKAAEKARKLPRPASTPLISPARELSRRSLESSRRAAIVYQNRPMTVDDVASGHRHNIVAEQLLQAGEPSRPSSRQSAYDKTNIRPAVGRRSSTPGGGTKKGRKTPGPLDKYDIHAGYHMPVPKERKPSRTAPSGATREGQKEWRHRKGAMYTRRFSRGELDGIDTQILRPQKEHDQAPNRVAFTSQWEYSEVSLGGLLEDELDDSVWLYKPPSKSTVFASLSPEQKRQAEAEYSKQIKAQRARIADTFTREMDEAEAEAEQAAEEAMRRNREAREVEEREHLEEKERRARLRAEIYGGDEYDDDADYSDEFGDGDLSPTVSPGRGGDAFANTTMPVVTALCIEGSGV